MSELPEILVINVETALCKSKFNFHFPNLAKAVQTVHSSFIIGCELV